MLERVVLDDQDYLSLLRIVRGVFSGVECSQLFDLWTEGLDEVELVFRMVVLLGKTFESLIFVHDIILIIKFFWVHANVFLER